MRIYAGGKEYFVVAGSPALSSLLSVLKAFSRFKKLQKSNMQLVVAVRNISRNADFMEKLDSYKYRNEVFLCDRLPAEDEMKLVSAAYALLYFQEDGNPATPMLN